MRRMFIGILLLASVLTGAAESRVWMSRSGIRAEAHLLSYHAETGIAIVRDSKTGKQAELVYSQLSEQDQKYLDKVAASEAERAVEAKRREAAASAKEEPGAETADAEAVAERGGGRLGIVFLCVFLAIGLCVAGWMRKQWREHEAQHRPALDEKDRDKGSVSARSDGVDRTMKSTVEEDNRAP